MALHPQAQLVLDVMAEANVGLDPDVTPTEMRALFDAATGLREGPDVARVVDRDIPGPTAPIPVRIYWPHGAGPHPLVLHYHGGGWVLGGLESHDATARELVDRTGAILVAVDYRLAPEAPFPAATDDAIAALRWVAANSRELGGDGTRLAVFGDSAGANLAAVTALRARDETDITLSFQGLVYPCTDMDPAAWPSMTENAEGYFLTTAAMEWFYGHYMGDQDRTHPHAAPLNAEDLTGLPPACVLTAEYDPLRDEGEAYAGRLRAAGVAVTMRRYDGMFHGFFGFTDLLDTASEAQAEMAQAIRSAFAASSTVP